VAQQQVPPPPPPAPPAPPVQGERNQDAGSADQGGGGPLGMIKGQFDAHREIFIAGALLIIGLGTFVALKKPKIPR
jgi:hypothetical protein